MDIDIPTTDLHRDEAADEALRLVRAGWGKGHFEKDGKVCLGGAVNKACTTGRRTDWATSLYGEYGRIAEIIREQFPERAAQIDTAWREYFTMVRNRNGRWEAYHPASWQQSPETPITYMIATFNDHDNTTQADVELVIEKWRTS